VLGQQHLCSKGGTEISVVGPHQLDSVPPDAFQQSVVRRATPALVDDTCSAVSSAGHNQATCLSRADTQDRSRRRLGAPSGQNLSKNLYALQLVSAHRQKSQSPPPPSGGRVGLDISTLQKADTSTLRFHANYT
jgi:hypothetical protein